MASGKKRWQSPIWPLTGFLLLWWGATDSWEPIFQPQMGLSRRFLAVQVAVGGIIVCPALLAELTKRAAPRRYYTHLRSQGWLSLTVENPRWRFLRRLFAAGFAFLAGLQLLACWLIGHQFIQMPWLVSPALASLGFCLSLIWTRHTSINPLMVPGDQPAQVTSISQRQRRLA